MNTKENIFPPQTFKKKNIPAIIAAFVVIVMTWQVAIPFIAIFYFSRKRVQWSGWDYMLPVLSPIIMYVIYLITIALDETFEWFPYSANNSISNAVIESIILWVIIIFLMMVRIIFASKLNKHTALASYVSIALIAVAALILNISIPYLPE